MRWVWLGQQSRTVMSGYALYAVTGHHENGALIERRIYLTCEYRRAKSVNDLLRRDMDTLAVDCLDWQLLELRQRDPFSQLR